jgi:hypothetical protein
MMQGKTRRYTIEVKDVDTDWTVLLTAVDWDDADKRVALAQIVRLAGVPGGDGDRFLDQVAPDSRRAASMPGRGPPTFHCTSFDKFDPACLNGPPRLLCAHMCKLGAEQYNLSRVVDPDQDHYD